MNTLATRSDLIIGFIRTAVPAAVGWLLAKLIVAVPFVAVAITWIDEQIAAAGIPGVTVVTLLNAAAIGLVVGLYWLAARELGKRWPIVERFLLGSSKQPVYQLQQGADGAWRRPDAD